MLLLLMLPLIFRVVISCRRRLMLFAAMPLPLLPPRCLLLPRVSLLFSPSLFLPLILPFSSFQRCRCHYRFATAAALMLLRRYAIRRCFYARRFALMLAAAAMMNAYFCHVFSWRIAADAIARYARYADSCLHVTFHARRYFDLLIIFFRRH